MELTPEFVHKDGSLSHKPALPAHQESCCSLVVFKFSNSVQHPRPGEGLTQIWTLDSWNKFQIPAAFCLSKKDKLSGLLNTACVFGQDLESSRSLLRKDIKHPVTLSLRTKINWDLSLPFLLPDKSCLVLVVPQDLAAFQCCYEEKVQSSQECASRALGRVAGRCLLCWSSG